MSDPWERAEKRFFLWLALLIAFIAGCGPAVAEASIAGAVEVKGLYSMGEKEFLDIFGIRRGSLIDREIVSNAIKTAFLKDIFDDIIVHVGEGEFPDVKVTVKERDFISGISVTGDSQLSRSTIRDLFGPREGGVMRYDRLAEDVNDLREKVALYGYPQAKIEAAVRKTGRPHRVEIAVTVDTNAPATIMRAKLDLLPAGARYGDLDRSEMLGALSIGEGDIYNQVKLERNLNNLKAFLKEKGYYNPVVGPYSFKEGELTVKVQPGRHLSVEVKGNSALSEKSLLKEMPFFEVGDFSDNVVEEAMSRIVALYHREGYPFVRIEPAIHEGAEDVAVTFNVVEGEKIRVGKVSFRNAGLPAERLRDVMSLREGDAYDPDLIEMDKESLKEFYGALGYLEASVQDVETKIDRASAKADVVVDMNPGERTEFSSVAVEGVNPELVDKLLSEAGIKKGDPYNEVDVTDGRLRLLAYFNARGYSGATVDIERNIREHRASILFKVNEGRKRFFGKTVITGNWKTRYKVIERELLYKEGDPYDFRILAEQRQRLYKLGLFSEVQIEPVPAAADTNDVLIKVQEARPGSVEFGAGYAEYDKFRGFVEVAYGNLWGMDREASLRIEASSLERRIILQYNEPWFMGSPKPLKTFFFYEHKKELNLTNKEILYKLNRFVATSGTEKNISRLIKAAVFYEFSLVHTWDVKPDVVLSKEDTGTLAISSIKPAVIYDARDNPSDPRKGFLAGASAKIATFLLLSEVNFVKLEVYGSKFRRLGRRVTLALGARIGLAYSLGKGTVELPIVERYFLGGGTTVRGYDQDTLGPKGADGNPTGGNAFLMGNVELRTNVGKGLGLVPFLDMGNVWQKVREMDPTDLKFTAGMGLRYATPVGPLRVDYGFKLNKDPGESLGALHFSIGHAF